MQITLTIDTASPGLTDVDRRVLQTILGDEPTGGSTEVTEPAVKPATRPTPAKAPAKPVEPEPEPEEEEDLIGGGPTVQDAVDRATELVNAGKQPKVKAGLKAIGADRVSNIPESKVQAFLDAVAD